MWYIIRVLKKKLFFSVVKILIDGKKYKKITKGTVVHRTQTKSVHSSSNPHGYLVTKALGQMELESPS